MGKKRTFSSVLNDATYLDYYYRLKELAINVYEWCDLPNSVDERFLELTLFDEGFCIYFDDIALGNLALKSIISGELNVYNIPINRQAIASNGYNKSLNINNSVLIYNNYLRTPSHNTVDLFCKRLCNIERTIDINVNAQKTPVLILSPEQQRLTMKNLYHQYEGNEPFIFGDKSLAKDDVTVLKTDAPYICDKLQILKNQIWNEALTFLGIENSNMDKKERLVSNEVNGNSGDIEGNRYVMLNARRQAANQINEMFGTNITVRFRSKLETLVNKDNLDIDDMLESGDYIE